MTTTSGPSDGGVGASLPTHLTVAPPPARSIWPAHLSAPPSYTPFFISNILGLQRPDAFGFFPRPPLPTEADADDDGGEQPLNLTVRGGGGEASRAAAAANADVGDQLVRPGKQARKGELCTAAPVSCLAGDAHRPFKCLTGIAGAKVMGDDWRIGCVLSVPAAAMARPGRLHDREF